jgi:osmotically inducible lipoprotein OsmB
MGNTADSDLETMTTKIIPSLAAITLCFGLGACATGPTTQDAATIGGAVVGGIAGAVLTGGNTAATIGGAALGGLAGNRIGKNMK